MSGDGREVRGEDMLTPAERRRKRKGSRKQHFTERWTDAKLGVVYGDSDTTFGGKAIGFHASVRLKLTTGKYIKSEDRRVGKWVHVETKKNKLTAPLQTCSVPLYFGEGIFEDEALIPFGVKVGAIQSSKNGRYIIVLDGEEVTFTKKTWSEVLDDNYSEVGEVITAAYQSYKSGEQDG